MERSSPIIHAASVCARFGQGREDGEPLVVPIAQTTAFARNSVDSRAEHAYSRCSNPTVDALERALGQLEQAPPAVCFSTGLGAETALFLALLRAGDHVICGRAVYGGTTRLLQQFLPALGVETTFVDAADSGAIAAAVRASTRLVFIETPANPTLELTDIAAAAGIAHDAGALLAVDNTFLTAALQRPLDLGADVSVYSTTKFLEGHSTAMGGALVARDQALLDRLRFTRKSTGGIQTPFNAWLTIQGLRTLPLRLRRQSETAATVARWLEARPQVARTLHPALDSFPQRALADRQHAGSLHGAVVSFELAAGADAAHRFVRHLRDCRLVEHVGSVETLITHSASMTHADVPPDERLACGVTDGLLRISVGLEPADAVIEDLQRGFDALADAPAEARQGGEPWLASA